MLPHEEQIMIFTLVKYGHVKAVTKNYQTAVQLRDLGWTMITIRKLSSPG